MIRLEPRASLWKAGLVLVILLGLFGSVAMADLIFTLTPNTESGPPGALLTYTGTLSNTGPGDLFLNDIQLTFLNGAGAFLTADTTVFFNNVPGLFFNGDAYAGPIFGVQIDPGALGLDFEGIATILGGDDPLAANPLASQNFVVHSTPEPATCILFLLGSGTAIMVNRRKRKP